MRLRQSTGKTRRLPEPGSSQRGPGGGRAPAHGVFFQLRGLEGRRRSSQALFLGGFMGKTG